MKPAINKVQVTGILPIAALVLLISCINQITHEFDAQRCIDAKAGRMVSTAWDGVVCLKVVNGTDVITQVGPK